MLLKCQIAEYTQRVCSVYHQVCSLVSLCSVKFLENNFLFLWNSFSSLVCTFLHCTLREWILWYYWCWVCDETKREGTPGSIKAPAAAHSPRPHSPLQKKASQAGPTAMAMGFFLLKLDTLINKDLHMLLASLTALAQLTKDCLMIMPSNKGQSELNCLGFWKKQESTCWRVYHDKPWWLHERSENSAQTRRVLPCNRFPLPGSSA